MYPISQIQLQIFMYLIEYVENQINNNKAAYLLNSFVYGFALSSDKDKFNFTRDWKACITER